MALALGETRKDLSADALYRLLRSHFRSLPDPRAGEVEIPLGDALMSASAMFALKDPSLLAFDHRRRDPNDNFRTIYGINRVPSDSQMRAILDPLDPASLRPAFQDVFRCLQRGKALERFLYRDGHYLVLPDRGGGHAQLSRGGRRAWDDRGGRQGGRPPPAPPLPGSGTRRDRPDRGRAGRGGRGTEPSVGCTPFARLVAVV